MIKTFIIFHELYLQTDLRDLYELLIRNDGLNSNAISRYSHQMERKGGRSPTIRLRFGRRSDPIIYSIPEQQERTLNDNL